MQTTRPHEEDEEDVRLDGEEECEGPRVDARYVNATRVWETEEQGRRECIKWVNSMGVAWAWFATFTFRGAARTAMSARSSLVRWLSAWPVGEKPFSRVVYSVESHLLGGAHIHAIASSASRLPVAHCERCAGTSHTRDPQWYVIKESWFHHYGICRIYPFDESIGHGGMAYVLKYILADTTEEWGILDLGKEF